MTATTLRLLTTALLLALAFGASCRDPAPLSEPPPVPTDPTRVFVESLVLAVDDDLRAHAEAQTTGHAITELLDAEAKRPWNARVAGGIKYADLFQERYAARQNHKLFARSDGLTPRGEATLAVLAAADRHALDPAPYHIGRIRTLAAELRRLAEGDPAWETIELQADEAEALIAWMGRNEIDPHDPTARARILDALVGGGESVEAPAPRIATRVAGFRESFARSARLTAELELRLADGALRYARDMKHFNLARQTWRDLKAAGGSKALIYGRLRESFDELAGAESPDEVAAIFDALEPPHPQYRRLLDALERYRAIAAQGGWERVSPTEIRPGRRSPRIAALRERLAVEGFLDPVDSEAPAAVVEPPPALPAADTGRDAGTADAGSSADAGTVIAAAADPADPADPAASEPAEPAEAPFDPEVADEALIQAIKSYQETHQFRPTGEPSAAVWRSINVPIADRIAQLELTLQRWRESRYTGEDDYVFVNIPDFHAEVVRGGERTMRFRVVVGNNTRTCDPKTKKWVYPNATPVQVAEMDHLIVNPAWYVPERIIREEIEPEVRRDADWLAKHNYEEIETRDGGSAIRQLPGPDNALGLVKFIFPNRHNTYMHDTPKKKYFDYPVRAFSHGCVRVHTPLDLAAHLMERDGQGDRARLDAILESGKTIKITLDQPLPVYFEYYVVRVDDGGRTHFLADIYRLDQARLADDPAEVEGCTVRRRIPVATETEGDDDAPAGAEQDLGP